MSFCYVCEDCQKKADEFGKSAQAMIDRMRCERDTAMEEYKKLKHELEAELRDPNGTIWECAKREQDRADKAEAELEDLHAELRHYKERSYHSMILGAGDGLDCVPKNEAIRFKLEAIKEKSRADAMTDTVAAMEKALKPFAENAEWASDPTDGNRACGVGCDMGAAGPGQEGEHDPRCPMEAARVALAAKGVKSCGTCGGSGKISAPACGGIETLGDCCTESEPCYDCQGHKPEEPNGE